LPLNVPANHIPPAARTNNVNQAQTALIESLSPKSINVERK